MRVLTTLNEIDQAAHVFVDAGDGLHLCLDDRLLGSRRDNRSISLELTGPDLPAELSAVLVRGMIGSDEIERHYEPEPGLTFEHEWSGAGGPAGRPCIGELEIGWQLAGRFPRPTRTRWWNRQVVCGNVDLRPAGCGGFTPAVVPRLDIDGDVLWRADGSTLEAASTRLSAALSHLTIGSGEAAVVDGHLVHVFDLQGRFEGSLHGRRHTVTATAEHDAWGRLAGFTARGQDYTIEHEHEDGSTPGNELLIESPSEVWIAIELDDDGRAVTLVDHDRFETRLRYDEHGALIRIDDPHGAVTEIERDALGRVDALADSSGRRVAVNRLGEGHVSTTTSTGRRDTRLRTRHDDGTVSIRETSEHGLERSIETDGTRRVVTLRNGMSVTSEHTIRGGGSSVVEVEHELIAAPSGRTLRRMHEVGRTGERITIGENQWAVELDTDGTTSLTTPKGLTRTTTADGDRGLDVDAPGAPPVRVEFDKHGRPKRRRYGDVVMRCGYDQYGRLAWTEVDRLRQQAQHDAQGRMVGVKTPEGWIRFERDASGWIDEIRNARGETVEFVRGTAGRIEQIVHPVTDGGARYERFTHDGDGRLIGRSFGPDETEAGADEPAAIRYERDDRGRIASIAADGIKIRADYDQSTGQLIEMSTDAGNTVSWVWDGDMSWAEESTGFAPARVERVFNDDLEIAVRSVNRALSIGYERNEDGRLTSVGPLRLEHNPSTGACIGIHLGGLSTMREFDENGRLIRHETRLGMMATVIFAEQIERDELGRIVSVLETVNGVERRLEYRYDDRNRLRRALVDGEMTVALAHDANDNIIEITRGERGVALAAGADDRLLTIAGAPVQHDDAGNLVGLGPDGAIRAYRFDGLNQLIESTDGRGRTTSFVLDVLGRPIGISVDDGSSDPGASSGRQPTRLVWDSEHVVATLGADDEVDLRFVGTREQAAPEAVVRGGVEYRLLCDHMGSVRMVVNATTGTVVQEIVFDALGRTVSDTMPGWQPFGWAGGLQDPTSGVVRFGQRVYDPFIGRFIGPHPEGFAGGSTNLYQCADGDPVNNNIEPAAPVDLELAPSSSTGEMSVLDDRFVLERPMPIDRVWTHSQRWRSNLATAPVDDPVSGVRASWSVERAPFIADFGPSWHALEGCEGRDDFTYVPTDTDTPSLRERIRSAIDNRPTAAKLAPQLQRELTAVVDSLHD